MKKLLVFTVVLALVTLAPVATAGAVDMHQDVMVVSHLDLTEVADDGAYIYYGSFRARADGEIVNHGAVLSYIYPAAGFQHYTGYATYYGVYETATVSIVGELRYEIEDGDTLTLVYAELQTIIESAEVTGKAFGRTRVIVSPDGIHVVNHMPFHVRPLR